MNEAELLALLQEQRVAFKRHEHPAVFTCEQSARLLPDVGGAGTKNLYLVGDRSRQGILLMVCDHKRVDFKKLAADLGEGNLSFAPPQRMLADLGMEPGSMTIFAILNDPDGRVRVVIDRELWQAEAIHAHPLTNTATLLISPAEVERFLQICGRGFELMVIPEKHKT